MVWRADGPSGNESAKIAFEVVPYMRGRCLDVGCGPTKVLPAPHIVGIDNNVDAQLFGIVARPEIFASGDRLDMFADESMDTIFSAHLLEHIEDYKATLRDWWRVLKTGGYLVLYLPHAGHYPNRGMPGSNPDHKHDFLPHDITQAMREVAWRSGTGWKQLRDETRTRGFEYSFFQVYRKQTGPRVELYEDVPLPKGNLGLVRLGAYGDALWISAVLPKLKQKYGHVTLYTQPQGEASLRLDPHLDEIVVQPEEIFGKTPADLQARYWEYLEGKHDNFLNLVGCVERHLLPHPADPNYWLPVAQRRRLMNRNYLEAVHEWAGVEFDPKTVRVKFTPSAEEIAWAAAKRAEFEGPMAVISVSGSSLPKWWPHAQRAMEILDASGVSGVLLGDLRHQTFKAPPKWQVIGTGWTIRQCYTLASIADVVIGTESAIVNSVAHEPPLKIVLMSHSRGSNLTRDWTNAVAVEPENLACYPCHRIHATWEHCTLAEGRFAACQHAATPEIVCGMALQWIRGEMKEAA